MSQQAGEPVVFLPWADDLQKTKRNVVFPCSLLQKYFLRFIPL